MMPFNSQETRVSNAVDDAAGMILLHWGLQTRWMTRRERFTGVLNAVDDAAAAGTIGWALPLMTFWEPVLTMSVMGMDSARPSTVGMPSVVP